MGHDVHFLERLERFDIGQAERALGLYRNPELVKALLSELALPEGTERIAIALDAAEPSAHVIVSRDGGFVTCLAAEMSTRGAFTVSRAQLDGARARHERLRTAVDVAGSGELARAFKHLTDEARTFSREEAQLLAAIQPLIGSKLAMLGRDIFEGHLKLVRRLVARDAPEHRRRNLRYLWNLQWAAGVVLSAPMAQGVPPAVLSSDDLTARTLSGWLGATSSILLLRATGARGLWACARLGRHALSELKHQRTRLVSMGHMAVVNLTLGLVALRHPKYRAEIVKALQTPAGQGEADPQRSTATAEIDALSREPVLKMLADPEKAQADCDAHLDRWKREVAAESPVDAGALYFSSWTQAGGKLLLWPYECMQALPWLARARFEDLFAPRGTFSSAPVGSEQLEYLAEVAATAAVSRTAPVRAAPQVGRNDPCPCGSGKKAKKCCAA